MFIRLFLVVVGLAECLLVPCLNAQPMDFQQALKASTERHPALLSMDANISAKRYSLDAAKAQRYPSVSASYGLDQNDNEEGVLSVRQPVWAFDRIDSSIAYARQDVQVQYKDRVRLLRNLVKDTAVAYLNVWGIQQQLLIVDDNIKQHTQLLEQVKRREKGKLASAADVALASSRLIQAKGQQIKLIGEHRNALLSLQTLTQLPVEQVAAIQPRWLQLPDAQRIIAQVLSDSAEVEYRQQLVSLAQKQVRQARADYLPTLYVRVSHDFSDRSFYANETRVSLYVEGNLEGLGLVTLGHEQSSLARLNATKRDVEVSQFELRNQLNGLLSQRKMQQELMVGLQAVIDELNSTLESYQRQYQSGRKAWMDVLNIYREITEQRLALAQAQNSLDSDTIQLAAMLGQLDVWPVTVNND
ncbi:TolC family protein [Shewanella sp. A3A]|nr:TolC family protein [Shewanella ferrihydritica]